MSFHEFTLIELLIVISIIAILAGLLLPALSNARDRAKSIGCLANLKQCGTAFSMYANDYNEWLPPSVFYRADPVFTYWAEKFITDFQYLTEKTVYCNGWKRNLLASGEKYRQTYGVRTVMYGVMSGTTMYKPSGHLINLAKTISPSKYFVAGDSGTTSSGTPQFAMVYNNESKARDQDAGNAGQPLHFRHPGVRANAVFADGSAKSNSRDDFIKLVDGWGPLGFLIVQ